MRILFAIFVLCLCALLWATFAITRHIQRQKQATAPHVEGDEPLPFSDLESHSEAVATASATTSQER